jgi:hypothetical protein
MTRRKGPLIEALVQGLDYTYQVPQGGDLSSMRAALKHGQVITLSPVSDFHQVQAGDIVLVKWRGGSYILHLVQEVQGDQFLIVNSLGNVNGWVHGSAILGRVTRIVDPEPHSNVPEMLDQLRAAYRRLAERTPPPGDEAGRLDSIVDDLRWYAGRIGPERWARLPAQNKWSFESHMWHLVEEARQGAASAQPRPLRYYIDHGKKHVGFVAENMALLEGETYLD